MTVIHVTHTKLYRLYYITDANINNFAYLVYRSKRIGEILRASIRIVISRIIYCEPTMHARFGSILIFAANTDAFSTSASYKDISRLRKFTKPFIRQLGTRNRFVRRIPFARDVSKN